MGRGLFAGMSWGALVGILTIALASQLTGRRELTPAAPHAATLEVPGGSEFNQARPETDPILPAPDAPPAVTEAVAVTEPEPSPALPAVPETGPAPAPETAEVAPEPAPSAEAPGSAGIAAPSADTPPASPGAISVTTADPAPTLPAIPEPESAPAPETADVAAGAEAPGTDEVAAPASDAAPRAGAAPAPADVPDADAAVVTLPQPSPVAPPADVAQPMAPAADAADAAVPAPADATRPAAAAPGSAPEAPSAPPAVVAGAVTPPAAPAIADTRIALSQAADTAPSDTNVGPPPAPRADAPPGVGAAAPAAPRAEAEVAQAPAAPEAPDQGSSTPGDTGILRPGFAGADSVRVNRLPTIGAEPAGAPDAADAGEGVEAGTETAQTAGSALEVPAILRNAVPFENPDLRPVVAVVLLHARPAAPGAETGRDLPVPVSFAVDAGLLEAGGIADAYRAAGREIVLVPTLPPGAAAADVEVALQVNFDVIPEAVAIMDLPDGGFQTERQAVAQVVAAISATGHGFVTFPRGLNTAQQVADRAGIPSRPVFRMLEPGNTDAALRTLDQAAFRARQEGTVILVGEAEPATVEAIRRWDAANGDAEIVFAPISAALAATE